MVLASVSSLEKIHYIAIFNVRNGKFSRLGEVTYPHTLLNFVPGNKQMKMSCMGNEFMYKHWPQLVYIEYVQVIVTSTVFEDTSIFKQTT